MEATNLRFEKKNFNAEKYKWSLALAVKTKVLERAFSKSIK